MDIVWAVILAAGAPSAVTSLIIGWFVKRQNEKEKAREEINFLLIQGIGASISLGEAVAIALKNGKSNGETEKALNYAKEAKNNIVNFTARQSVKNIV